VVTFLVIWTLAVATALVVVLAAYLIAIAYYLYRAGGGPRSHLAQLAGGLVAIRQNAAPLEEKMAAVARALVALRGELQATDEYLAEASQTLRR
jgi:hypothetical protein